MVSPFIGSLSTSIQKINCQDPLSTENEKIKETKRAERGKRKSGSLADKGEREKERK